MRLNGFRVKVGTTYPTLLSWDLCPTCYELWARKNLRCVERRPLTNEDVEEYEVFLKVGAKHGSACGDFACDICGALLGGE